MASCSSPRDDYDDTVPDLVGGGGGGTEPPAFRELLAFRAPGGCCRPSRRDAEKKNPPEGLALTSKFSLTKNENLVVLGTTFAPATLEMASDKTTRAEEAVASAASNEAGSPGANTTTATTTGPEPTSAPAGKAGKKKNKKKKSAKKAASSAVGGDATAATSEDAAKDPAANTRDAWAQIWALLKSSRDVATDQAHHAMVKEMLSRVVECTAPGGSPTGPPGPVCGNPNCGKFGHTIAVCPVPTCPTEGHMSGCFFCNVVYHDADDCTMMEWASPATLANYLITNRAGKPPWNTRINWVDLAIDQWDLVCFTMLPLTHSFVRKEYVPGKRWVGVNGVSPITDPLFKNASLKYLKSLAKAKRDESKSNRSYPLMEASRVLCYCKNDCFDGFEHAVFKNEFAAKYIPDIELEFKFSDEMMAAHERDLAASEMQMAKKLPKKVTKERKGRRAMKKDAMAAAAAEEEVAGPSQQNNTATGHKNQVKKEQSPPSVDEKEVPLSEKLMDIADAVDDVIDSLQKTVKS
ncbi:hypothetical protein C8A01DRAFT_31669 [Parachaetomium inaequale]|uniref:Uncharacterized protein n=1 Tax=Parachaetomium inaequale TaxID=2588326 RepID=A0AAN6PNI3_9PEZI|nr:hypothetical protein C8A01DRAFT_31669 [Parachaetomium inaequale]